MCSSSLSKFPPLLIFRARFCSQTFSSAQVHTEVYFLLPSPGHIVAHSVLSVWKTLSSPSSTPVLHGPVHNRNEHVCVHVWGVGCSHFHSVWSTWTESECGGRRRRRRAAGGRVRGEAKAVIWEGYPTVQASTWSLHSAVGPADREGHWQKRYPFRSQA